MTSVTSNGKGSHLALHDDLVAGFLLLGRNDSRKQLGAFSIKGEGAGAVVAYVRPCESDEKYELKKEIYFLRTVHSIRAKTRSGESCMLFVRK